jgi:gliding motility-associated-like protein
MNIPAIYGPPYLSYPLCNLDNLDGCPISTDISASIMIPNIFTPNGDQVNEVFSMTTVNVISLNSKIYDRWGELIFESSEIKGTWDGKDKSGASCPDGIYFYLITYSDVKHKTVTKNGFVQLIR